MVRCQVVGREQEQEERVSERLGDLVACSYASSQG